MNNLSSNLDDKDVFFKTNKKDALYYIITVFCSVSLVTAIYYFV